MFYRGILTGGHFKREDCSDPPLPTTPRIGTGGKLVKFRLQSPPLFNYLHRTPQDHLLGEARM